MPPEHAIILLQSRSDRRAARRELFPKWRACLCSWFGYRYTVAFRPRSIRVRLTSCPLITPATPAWLFGFHHSASTTRASALIAHPDTALLVHRYAHTRAVNHVSRSW